MRGDAPDGRGLYVPDMRPVHVLFPAGESVTLKIYRSPSPLPRTRTIIRAGSIAFPMTQPDERTARRRWREYHPPAVSVVGAGFE